MIDELIKNEALIRTFIEKNPEDSRTPTMKRVLDEVELEQRSRRFQRQARQLDNNESLGIVEQDYLRITQLLNEDVSTGYNQLCAFVDLYENMPDMTTEQSQCIELARRQIAQLQPTINESIPKNLKVIESRLSDAEKMSKESPDKARNICKGIIALYRDRLWAADVVTKAEKLLDKLQNVETSATK
jgi:ribosomal protein L29